MWLENMDERNLKEEQNVLSMVERRPGKNIWISGEEIMDETSKQNTYSSPPNNNQFCFSTLCWSTTSHFLTFSVNNFGATRLK